MAFNMAYSIKHNSPKTKVHLVADSSIEYLPHDRRFVFDSIEPAKPEDYISNGSLDPGKLKSRIYKYLPFKHNLYLDVDGLVLSDLSNAFTSLISDDRWYITSEQGRGKLTEKINYSEWATNEAIQEHFKLKDSQELVAIQSSWAYIQKGREAQKFFKEVEKEFEKFPKEKLNYDWGGTMPDELIFSGLISKHNLKVDGLPNLMFFGSSGTAANPAEVEKTHTIMSVYGNGRGRTMTPLRYWDHYDRLMFAWTKKHRLADDELSTTHIYKSTIVKPYKHANRHQKK